MNTKKNIPFKNYIILSFVLILSIVLVIYFYMWYGEIKNNQINFPIMDKYLSVINYNELDNYLIENNNVIVYISVLDNNDVRKFENKFKKIIYKFSLNDVMVYLNLTEEFNSKKLYNNFIAKYNLSSLPCIVVFKDGVVDDVYNIKDYNYDVDLLISYLRIEGVIND